MRSTARRSPTKEKRSWWLSDEAFLSLKALAEQQGVEIPQFLEVHCRELALERLPASKRAEIQAEAKRLAERRQADAPA